MMAEQLAAADRAAFTGFQVFRPAGDPAASLWFPNQDRSF
jgi:hypothetical protein